MVTLEQNFKIDEAFKGKVENLLQSILVSTHGIGPKSRIKKMHNRLNFACPYCGDSSTDNLKKRGNLFWDSLHYHCYNYGCSTHKSVHEFIKDFAPDGLTSGERIAVVDYIKNNAYKNTKQVLKHEVFEKIYKLAIPVETFILRTGAQPIKKDSVGFDYLKDRLLIRASDEFLYSNDKLYVLNLTNDGKRIVGFQIRNLKRSSAKYLTYNIEKLYRFCGLELKDDEIEKLNEVSTLFGIMNIDFTKPVTTFEGPIDSKFIGNSIALCTVGRNVEQLNEIPTVRYFFDNDKSGKDAMMALLKSGKEVFLWSKFIKDFNLDQYKIEDSEGRKKDIKDLNDLIIICYRNKLNAYKYINKYFSSNSLDCLYV
jgi:hypothetical protein